MRGQGYFLAQLPYPALNVAAAEDILKPAIVQQAPSYLRQGEWFFIPTEKPLVPVEIAGAIQKHILLSNRNPQRLQQHRATNYIEANGQVYVSGTIRHISGDHKMLPLKGWCTAHENTEIRSFRADGRVD